KLKTDDIQFFELTYRLEKSRNSHPLAFAQVVNFQLLGSYQVNDDGSYKYLTIRVLTSAESLEAPNGGHGSSSTAN
ncbi:MAG: hypothetical protein NTV34_07240, partial [Proteobacteria bacterium]|nr:hypothetical protein [Pseudomonadota bacterium]